MTRLLIDLSEHHRGFRVNNDGLVSYAGNPHDHETTPVIRLNAEAVTAHATAFATINVNVLDAVDIAIVPDPPILSRDTESSIHVSWTIPPQSPETESIDLRWRLRDLGDWTEVTGFTAVQFYIITGT